MAKRSKKKKQSLFIKLANTVFTVALAGIMAYGLQCYSAATSLKFAQVSDAHFYTGEDNTSFKLRAESDKLLDDAVDQINETPAHRSS